MRKIFYGLVLLLGALIIASKTSSPIYAQGTFTCKYIDAAEACVLDQNNCDSSNNYTVDLNRCQSQSGQAKKAACTAQNPITCIAFTPSQPPQVTPNTYGCEVDRGNGICILRQSGNNCSSGYYPGSQCSTTPLGTCESVEYSCISTDTRGQENQPCKPGNICNSGLYCNLQGGFICQKCGGLNEICCPGPSLACGAANGLHCNNENRCVQGRCGVDTYNGEPTFCSVTAGPERIIAPGFSGCRTGEYCVTNRPTSTCGGRGQNCCPPPKLECYQDGYKCINNQCVESISSNGITCDGGSGINTALGCIPAFDINGLTAFVLRWAVGIGGGIAFLLMVYAGFMIMTSSGNPERLKAGQELLTSAVTGLIMLIFSIFILRIIGVNILQITGFGSI